MKNTLTPASVFASASTSPSPTSACTPSLTYISRINPTRYTTTTTGSRVVTSPSGNPTSYPNLSHTSPTISTPCSDHSSYMNKTTHLIEGITITFTKTSGCKP